MHGDQLRYTTGEEIQLGDRVQFSGTFGTVVMVSDGETCQTAPGYEDYAGAERGLLICDDDGALTNLDAMDERLVFIDRGTI